MVFYHVNRLCNICIDAEIGDEFHYILQCKSLINERKLFLSQYFFMQNHYFKICSIIPN
jgi:hypothetical protein